MELFKIFKITSLFRKFGKKFEERQTKGKRERMNEEINE